MHIFVTGATGFIGSHFVRKAIAVGHTVTALRHRTSISPDTPWPHPPRWLSESLVTLSTKHLEGVDAIAHFAAVGVSPRVATWDELQDVNIHSTIRLCQLAKKLGCRITISGSYAEYGLSGNRYSCIPANAPLEPTFPYAASKAAASVLATSFARSECIELAYLRIFNAYGEGQFERNLWPSLRLAALNGDDFPLTLGEQVRDFVDVETVSTMFLASLSTSSIVPGKPLVANAGSGNPQTTLDFCRHWWQRWNAKGHLKIGALPYRKGEVMRYVPELDSELLANY